MPETLARAGPARRGTGNGAPGHAYTPGMPGEISGIFLVAAFATLMAACVILAVRLIGASSPGKGS